MNASTWLVLWGSPVGIAVFFAGLGVLLWGLSLLNHSKVARAELELRERQRFDERARASEGGTAPAR